MKWKLSWTILIGLILMIIIVAAVLDEEGMGTFRGGSERHVYFAKWQAYLGYALYEGEGKIQLPFLDEHSSDKQFAGKIKEISLNLTYENTTYLPTNIKAAKNPIIIKGFTVLNYSDVEGRKYNLRALEIPFSIREAGLVRFNELTLYMSNGDVFSWDVGQWEIEIKKLDKEDDFLQGDGRFSNNPTPNYYLEIINSSGMPITCNTLVFDQEKAEKRVLEDKEDHIKLANSLTEMIVYQTTIEVSNPNAFYYIKPFLSYSMGDQLKLVPLEATDVISAINDEDYHIILGNKGKKE